MDILDIIGEFGRFQKQILLVVCLRSIPLVFTFYLVHFSSPVVNHWCKQDIAFENASQEVWGNYSEAGEELVFWNLSRGGWSNLTDLRQCERYGIDDYDGDFGNATLLPCNEWEYEKNREYSLRSEWDIVCDRKWLLSMTYAAFFSGNMVSFPVAGYIGDRFGRRTMVLMGIAGLAITNTILFFSPSLIWFMVIRFISGFPYTLLMTGSVTLFMEMCGKKQRALTTLVTGSVSACAQLLMIGTSLYVTRWKHLVLIASLPITLPLLVLFWKCLYESPRWLIIKGKVKEAKEVLEVATKKNGIKIQDMDNVLKALEQKIHVGKNNTNEQTKAKFTDFFMDRKLLFITLVLLLSFAVNKFTSSGFVITLRSLGGSYSANFAISAALTFFTSIADTVLMIKVTRRRSILVAALSLAGVLFLITTALGKDLQWLRITVALLARTINTLISQVSNLFVNEFFPTRMRVRGSTLCATAGRIGSILSSFSELLSQSSGANAPYFLFGGLNLLVAVGFFLCPEIDNNNLPDTLEESKRYTGSKAQREELPDVAVKA